MPRKPHLSQLRIDEDGHVEQDVDEMNGVDDAQEEDAEYDEDEMDEDVAGEKIGRYRDDGFMDSLSEDEQEVFDKLSRLDPVPSKTKLISWLKILTGDSSSEKVMNSFPENFGGFNKVGLCLFIECMWGERLTDKDGELIAKARSMAQRSANVHAIIEMTNADLIRESTGSPD